RLPIPAQHVQAENIRMPVMTNVGNVHPHRTSAGMAYGQIGTFVEMSFSIVDPNPVRRPKIVADIYVRRAVTVEIPKCCRQAPIPGRGGHGRSVRFEECTIGPGYRRKMSPAIIEVKLAGFTVFLNGAVA